MATPCAPAISASPLLRQVEAQREVADASREGQRSQAELRTAAWREELRRSRALAGVPVGARLPAGSPDTPEVRRAEVRTQAHGAEPQRPSVQTAHI